MAFLSAFTGANFVYPALLYTELTLLKDEVLSKTEGISAHKKRHPIVIKQVCAICRDTVLIIKPSC